MSVVGSQQRIFLRLVEELRGHWRSDPALPARIQILLTKNRSFGSRDRRLYRELIYTILRHLPWLEPLLDTAPATVVKTVAWLAADVPVTHSFRAASVGDWPACPSLVDEKAALLSTLAPEVAVEASLLPTWFKSECPAAFASPDYDALNRRARLWLRLQTDNPAAVLAEFAAHDWAWTASSALSSAIALNAEIDVTKSDAYARGAIEIQDLGSQMILASAAIEPGERWFDACAGAGGKTLQLAHLLGPAGHVDAFDIRPDTLGELRTRATRSRFANIRTLERIPAETYDGVLVDAPCSGSGTWRRSPHLKWTSSPAQIEQAARQQRELLGRFAASVRRGGRLIYATCSLSQQENENVVAAFLAATPEFSIEPPRNTFGLAAGPLGLSILPARHDTDGFFVAILRRR